MGGNGDVTKTMAAASSARSDRRGGRALPMLESSLPREGTERALGAGSESMVLPTRAWKKKGRWWKATCATGALSLPSAAHNSLLLLASKPCSAAFSTRRHHSVNGHIMVFSWNWRCRKPQASRAKLQFFGLHYVLTSACPVRLYRGTSIVVTPKAARQLR